MIFAYRDPAACAGFMLGHSLSINGKRLRKGHWISQHDINAMLDASITQVFAGAPEAGDMAENDAAQALARAAAGPNTAAEKPHTGRCNLVSTCDGVITYDRNTLIELNEIHQHVTLAMVPPFATVRKDDLIGTVKIIPFAVQQSHLEASIAQLGGQPLCQVQPFMAAPCALLETRLEAVKPLSPKILEFTRTRVERVGLTLVDKQDCAHSPADVAAWVQAKAKAQASEPLNTQGAQGVLLVFGASATVDEADVIPAAIAMAGGTVERVGMAADPGNLLVYGRLEGTVIIGLPGCAKSPALNGFDWVLERTAAGLPITPRDWAEMSVGGLLKEIEARPQLRRPAMAIQKQTST